MIHIINLPKRITPLVFFLMVSVKGFTQIPVTADPAFSAFDITELDDTPADANNLLNGSFYLLKLGFLNLHPNDIPPGTAYIRIGLGLNMILDPAFNLSTAPYSEYITWSYDVSQSQPLIIGVIHTALPGFFFGDAVFRVKANSLGTSIVSGQFLVVNPPGNPYILSDANPNNNSASIDYTVITGTTPVTLTKFNAVKKDCIIRTDWSVENELNFDHYELQVSKDGTNYSTINSVAAQNKSNYSSLFDINSLSDQLQGNNLYLRLKMVDKDASFKYSKIIQVSGKCILPPAFVIYGYPNPVIDRNFITIGNKEGLFNGRYNVTLMDMNGRMYGSREIELKNVQSFRFDFRTMLANGKYIIRLQDKNGTQSGVVQFEKN